MTKQNITSTTFNDELIKIQVNTKEFSSKTEAINYLTKQTRSQEEYYELVRAKIDKGEKSGFTEKQTREEMLAEFKKDLPEV